MKVRLQKWIANAGIASRRKAEELISLGEVVVNGKIITEMGFKVDVTKDHVKVQGKKIPPSNEQKKITFALYKPKSCVTTLSDPQGRYTIKNFFPKTTQRIYPVGRLDYDTEGLILLTNDGDLANQIMSPLCGWKKKYYVKVKGVVSQKEIVKLAGGLKIQGRKCRSVKARIIKTVNDKTWLDVTLQEGMNRQIKRMFFSLGFPVIKIKRYQIGPIKLLSLQPGEYRRLSTKELVLESKKL